MTRARTVFVALLGLSFGACAVGNRIVSGRGSYELYRTAHVAPTLEERLGAGNRYLKSDPDGPLADDLKAWFEPAEKGYVESAWNSLPRLRAYLKAMPDGPNAERVKARAEELEATVGFAQKREQESRERTAELQANLERAAEQRQAFIDDVTRWVKAFSAMTSWDKPLTELSPDVRAQFGGDNASDHCVGDLCSKAFTPRFAIPIKGKVAPREAAYTVELVVRSGAVAEARLHGRELFSRIGEALDRRPVSFTDPQSRAEGIGRALGLVTGAFGSAFPAETCEKPAVSPVVLERACGGVRVVATAALNTGDDDVLAFGPEAPPAPPAAPAKGQKGGAKEPSAKAAPKTPAPKPSALPPQAPVAPSPPP
ncbi:MAG TPA: hypothetical protein VF103_16975 [Polyangiaceae bacterium]